MFIFLISYHVAVFLSMYYNVYVYVNLGPVPISGIQMWGNPLNMHFCPVRGEKVASLKWSKKSSSPPLRDVVPFLHQIAKCIQCHAQNNKHSDFL